jgi:N-acetylmuramoyl-L-alanine amidase
MQLFKKVLAISLATTLTFTSIDLSVNATDYSNAQTEVTTDISTDSSMDTTQVMTSDTTLEEEIAATDEVFDESGVDLTTTQEEITVEVSDTQKIVNDALLENGTISLTQDLQLDTILELNLPESTENAELTIELNGFSITSDISEALMHISENVMLTIKGEGSLINNAENGIVIFNEGTINIDNADLLATGSKSVGVLNNSTLGEKGLVIKSGSIKAEWFAIGKTVKAEVSVNRPTAFFAAAGIIIPSVSADTIEQGTYSIDENATVTDETENQLTVSESETVTDTITDATTDTTTDTTTDATTDTTTDTTSDITTDTTITDSQETVVSSDVSSIDETSLDTKTTEVQSNKAVEVAPSQPVNVTATVNNYNSITISWDSVSDAEGYIVERIQPGTESVYNAFPEITATQYTDTTIAVGKEYDYHVYAYSFSETNEKQLSEVSSDVSAQTTIASPQSLTAVQYTTTKIKLNWNSVEGALTYNVYRAIKGGSYKLIKTLSGTYYKDSGLKTGSKYYYKVTAVNGDYETGYSNRVSLYAAAKAVTSLEASSSTYNKVDLTWKKASGATKYVIYRSTKETSSYSKIKTVTSTSYTDTSRKTGVTYYYKVVSYSDKAKGGTSSVVSATPVSAAPTNVKVVAKSYNSTKLTWTKAKGAGEYNIYRSTSKSSGYTLIKTVANTKTSYTDKTVVTGKTYYYKIRAVTRGDAGKKSKVVSVKVSPAAVTKLVAKSAGGKTAKLTWTAASGATSYQVYRSTKEKSGFSKVTTTTSLNYTDSGLTNGTTYYYRVYAKTGSLKSSYVLVSYVNPSKIYMSSTTLAMESGETSKLSVTYKPTKVTSSTITWTTANSSIATVSKKGVVTALASGVTTITATACNGKKATCEVSVDQETTGVVVVLDPGHGGSDPGAVSGSYKEKDLVLKISQYTKTELEKYSGITVKMTRTDDTYVGLEERTIIAKNYDADLFVSQHLNAATSSANGAEVFVSLNSTYNSDSTILGSYILDRLTGVGLNNRGVKTKLSSDGVNDYYSVIRNSVSRGFPGIIVESAFITGSDDVSIISTEGGLNSIGIATATAIAEYYGLSKK